MLFSTGIEHFNTCLRAKRYFYQPSQSLQECIEYKGCSNGKTKRRQNHQIEVQKYWLRVDIIEMDGLWYLQDGCTSNRVPPPPTVLLRASSSSFKYSSSSSSSVCFEACLPLHVTAKDQLNKEIKLKLVHN